MTVPIVGELELNRKPLSGRIAEAVHSFTLDISTSEVGQVVIDLIDPRLHLLSSNQLVRGHELTWTVAGFKRRMVIAVIELTENNDIEVLRLTCRPAAIEKMRNARGAYTWSGQSPTQWLANECHYWSTVTHTPITFVGQPTMTRTQIVRRAEKGKVPESSWDVAGALASEEGFWLFENAGTVYFGQPSWFATELAGSSRDQWTWPRPADGRTPFIKAPHCRASDYAQKAELQPAVVDGQVAMEYALGLAPGQSVRVEIPQFRGRYLITKVTIAAGEPLASVTAESPVDPAPHTDLVTINSPSVFGSDPATQGLTDVQVGAYFYNGLIEVGAKPTLDSVAIAIAIAFRESRFIVTQHNDVAPDDSWGLWQINVFGGIHGDVRTKFELLTHSQIPNWPDALTDPRLNGFGAALISGGGKNWQPWTTYNHNTYLSYLPAAKVAAAAVFQLPKNGALVQIPASAPSSSVTSARVEQFVQFCLAQRGDKYVIGSAGPDAFDCSGLVYAGLTSLGITGVPRTAASQWQWCKNAHKEISVAAAGQIRGAVMFKLNHPVSGTTGHVVVSLGDGIHTIEAMGTQYGVVVGQIANRFDHAALLPPLDYPWAAQLQAAAR